MVRRRWAQNWSASRRAPAEVRIQRLWDLSASAWRRREEVGTAERSESQEEIKLSTKHTKAAAANSETNSRKRAVWVMASYSLCFHGATGNCNQLFTNRRGSVRDLGGESKAIDNQVNRLSSGE